MGSFGPAGSGRQCWCFGSTGLQALGQKELVFLLECLPDEKVLPKDLFSLYLNIYQEAQKGGRPHGACLIIHVKWWRHHHVLAFQGSSWRNWTT